MQSMQLMYLVSILVVAEAEAEVAAMKKVLLAHSLNRAHQREERKLFVSSLRSSPCMLP